MVQVHDDHFAQDARDEAWLRAVGARRWVVLTKDRRIKSRTSEVAALMRGGVAAFVLSSANMNGERMALEWRLGKRARSTRDLDLVLRGQAVAGADLRERLVELLAVGYARLVWPRPTGSRGLDPLRVRLGPTQGRVAQ